MHFFTTTAHFIGFKAISEDEIVWKNQQQNKILLPSLLTSKRNLSILEESHCLAIPNQSEGVLNDHLAENSVCRKIG